MLRWRKFWWFMPVLAALVGFGVGFGDPPDAEAKRRKRPGKAKKRKGKKKSKKKGKSKGKATDSGPVGYQEDLPPSVFDELPPIGAESAPDPRKAGLRTDKTHGELRKHLLRMAKIDRIEEIAIAKNDDALKSKAEELRTLELRRHNLAVAALNAPPKEKDE